MNSLFLGSSSESRKYLLNESKIPFEVIAHTACEEDVPLRETLEETVQDIARYKMAHLVLPAGKEGQKAFVLTADSMGVDDQGVMYGKPRDKAHAIEMLKKLTGPEKFLKTATGFCLEYRVCIEGQWITQERIERVVTAHYEFVIPDQWIVPYIENSCALKASGSIAVEWYGLQFLKRINGSYSAVMGLPMFELREALELLGFFDTYTQKRV